MSQHGSDLVSTSEPAQVEHHRHHVDPVGVRGMEKMLHVVKKCVSKGVPHMEIEEHTREVETRVVGDRHVSLDGARVVVTPHVNVVDSERLCAFANHTPWPSIVHEAHLQCFQIIYAEYVVGVHTDTLMHICLIYCRTC